MVYWVPKLEKKRASEGGLIDDLFALESCTSIIYFHYNCSQGRDLPNSIVPYTPRTAREGPLPGLLLNTMNVPQDTRVVHHNDERPDTLAFNSQLFQAVPLQFQVVIWQLLNEKPGSTWKASNITRLHVLHSGTRSPADSSHTHITGMPVYVVTM